MGQDTQTAFVLTDLCFLKKADSQKGGFAEASLSCDLKIVTVSELTGVLRAEIEQAFSEVWVEGEVTNLRIPQSGHCYFTLKDETAQIRAVRFRSYGRFYPFVPKEGEFVLIRGRLTVYEARGEYQIVVEHIEPRGIGALMAAYEALKEQLRLEGLFDPIHKKQIPLYPRNIALITSPTGAVLHDFLTIIGGHDLPITIRIVPVPVQGEGAAQEISRTLDLLNSETSQPIDVLVLARGGGSLEDLWAFNEEVVARAIFRSNIPVISAIGHETDTTIADFVADLRAPTPSAAAEIIARTCEDTLGRFHRATDLLQQIMQERIERYRLHLNALSRLLKTPETRLIYFKSCVMQFLLRYRAALALRLETNRGQQALLAQRLASQHPVTRLARLRQRWEQSAHDLNQIGADVIKSRRQNVMTIVNQLDLLSPLNILGRGYSITEKLPSLKVVQDAGEVAIEETLQIRLHRGRVTCQVKETSRT